jgi:hypothetical protein
MLYTAASIDQSGKPVAQALHGLGMASGHDANDPEVVLYVGKNPLVSHGAWSANPGDFFKDMADRGATLIVIDPRRTETARRAGLHLRPLPGHDAAIIAAMLRVILTEDLHDDRFVTENTTGLDALRAAVEPFAPGVVAEAAGIAADDLVRAARKYAGAARGFASAGTGANMAGPTTLLEYLLLCLQTVCGYWRRAGEVVRNALTVSPSYAQFAWPRRCPLIPATTAGSRRECVGSANSPSACRSRPRPRRCCWTGRDGSGPGCPWAATRSPRGPTRRRPLRPPRPSTCSYRPTS